MSTILIIIILQAFVCGGFCAYIADQKNRSVPAWLLLGILFGLFALIAIAAVPKNSFESKKLPTGERQCPYCGAANMFTAKRCYACDKSI